MHARFERVADAAGTHGQRVHRDAEPLRQGAAAVDLRAPLVAVIVDDQGLLLRRQRLDAAIETIQPLFRPQRLTWYAARVERAKALMEAHYAEPLSLSTLARDAGMSVFHFARIFAELEGRPPHRFLSDVRLSHANARLRDGAAVTDTCFAVGFGSLSHFVTMFRRRYGVRPTDIRRPAARPAP